MSDQDPSLSKAESVADDDKKSDKLSRDLGEIQTRRAEVNDKFSSTLHKLDSVSPSDSLDLNRDGGDWKQRFYEPSDEGDAYDCVVCEASANGSETKGARKVTFYTDAVYKDPDDTGGAWIVEDFDTVLDYTEVLQVNSGLKEPDGRFAHAGDIVGNLTVDGSKQFSFRETHAGNVTFFDEVGGIVLPDDPRVDEYLKALQAVYDKFMATKEAALS